VRVELERAAAVRKLDRQAVAIGDWIGALHYRSPSPIFAKSYPASPPDCTTDFPRSSPGRVHILISFVRCLGTGLLTQKLIQVDARGRLTLVNRAGDDQRVRRTVSRGANGWNRSGNVRWRVGGLVASSPFRMVT
jgi:hypothetical protein